MEVRYDQMEGARFRHTAQFSRWRPDRDPRSCTYDQLERPVTFALGRHRSRSGSDVERVLVPLVGTSTKNVSAGPCR